MNTIKARRITGGAIVTITRADGRVHRHRIGLRRYHRLLDTLTVHRGLYGGDFRRHGFACGMETVAGLAASRHWAARHGNPGAKHWRAA